MKDIKGGFDTWLISLKSIKVDKPKNPKETKVPKETRFGVGVGHQIREILEKYKDVILDKLLGGLLTIRKWMTRFTWF